MRRILSSLKGSFKLKRDLEEIPQKKELPLSMKVEMDLEGFMTSLLRQDPTHPILKLKELKPAPKVSFLLPWSPFLRVKKNLNDLNSS